jgi:hypothetical protein
MGDQTHTMHFFLTNLGEQKVILGYPWFAAVQPVIDWAKGWIAYEQLPVVIKARTRRTTAKIHTATVISSASGMARGEVFYGPTDWLGSRDPMTPVRYTRGSLTGLTD